MSASAPSSWSSAAKALAFIVVSAGDNDTRTFLRESQGGGTSDTGQGAGNKDNGWVFRGSIHIV